MKRKILLLAIIAICAAIAASGTWAYITGVDEVHNVITSGNVDIDIDEKMETEDGELVDFPEEGVHDVMPDTDVSKIVTVQNTGEGAAWVRVRLEMLMWDKAGKELPVVLDVDGEESSAMSVEVDENQWIYHEGYYYYHVSVDPGCGTDVLFEEVHFSADLGNEYQECTANVIVHAEAVQVANNAIPNGGDVTDIQGWPET